MTDIERYHLNAPGPFFVEKDQCIACHAPEHEAPELMSFDEEGGSCYFHRQPRTTEEIEHAVLAVYVACCDAVRYGGTDTHILARLQALTEGVRTPRKTQWWQFWAR